MDYHDPKSKAITRTALKCFMESRSEFRDIYVDHKRPPKPPTRLMVEGQVLHAILVEGKEANGFLEVYPDSCLKSNGDLKPAKDGPAEFREQNPGKLCLKRDEMWRLVNLIGMVTRHPLIAEDVSDQDAIREQVIERNIDGVDCKAKPDLWRNEKLWDYKFMADISPLMFRTSAKRFKYWMQDQQYTRCALVSDLVFRCVETNPPYRVWDYWYDQESRQRAFDEHSKLLADLKQCRVTGEWCDVWPNEIDIKPWELSVTDDDLIGVEDYE
jgi:hypothetical protein